MEPGESKSNPLLDRLGELLDLPPEEQSSRIAGMALADSDRQKLEHWLRHQAEDHGAGLPAAPPKFVLEAMNLLSATIDELGGSHSGHHFQPPPVAPTVPGYQTGVLLGHGGMGAVWRAVQSGTGRTVALKVMDPMLLASPRARARFDRELRLTARLQHPNIARVFEGGSSGGVCYFAMELIEGVPLDQYAAQNHLSQQSILELMTRVCEGVWYAHQNGVIHRDLKPANILVDGTGQPHILDFGLARAIEEAGSDAVTSTEGLLAGTPAYMSPEMAAGARVVDTRSDVYALGVILYRLSTGKPPHDLRGSRHEVLRQIIEVDPPRPSRISSVVGVELETIILKALARKPEERYQSVGELGQEIGRFLRGEPLAAKPPTLSYAAKKWAGRNWKSVSIAAVLVAVCLVAALFDFLRLQADRDRIARANRSLQDANGALVANQKELIARQRELRSDIAARFIADADRVALSGRWSDAIAFYEASRRQSVELGMPLITIDMGISVALQHEPPSLACVEMETHTWEPDGVMFPRESIAIAHVIGGTHRMLPVDDNEHIWFLTRDGEVFGLNLLAGRSEALVGKAAPIKSDFPNVRDFSFYQQASAEGISVSITDDSKRFLVDDGARAQLLGSGRRIYGIAIAPDGRHMLSAEAGDFITLWDVARLKPLKTFEHVAGGFLPDLFAFANDSQTVAISFANHTVQMLPIQEGLEIRRLKGPADKSMAIESVTAAAFSMDGLMAFTASAEGVVRAWDLATGLSLETCRFPPDSHDAPFTVRGSAFSPDGMKVACTTLGDSDAGVFSTVTGDRLQIFHAKDRESRINAVQFSGDGQRIAAEVGAPGFSRCIGRVLNVGAGTAVANRHQSLLRATSIWLPEDNTVVSYGSQAGVWLWSAATGEVLRQISTGVSGLAAMAFASDGSTLIYSDTAGQVFTRTLRSADVAHLGSHSPSAVDAKDISRGLYIPEQWKCAIEFLPGTHIAISGGRDHTLHIWDIDKRQEVRVMNDMPPASVLVFSHDGKQLLIGGEDGEVVLWDYGRVQVYRDFSKRLAEAREATAANPADPAPYIVFGEWYAFRGIWNRALEYLQQAGQRGGSPSHLTQARCQWYLGRPDEALDEYRKALDAKEAPEYYLQFCIRAIEQRCAPKQ